MATAPVRDPRSPAPARPGEAARHRKHGRRGGRRWGWPVRAAAIAVAGAAALACGGAAFLAHSRAHSRAHPGALAGTWLSDAAGALADWSGAWASKPQIVSYAIASAYRNPLRDITGLIPERIDDGADFAGAGPVYPLGDAVITGATGSNFGWPGGGWITYRLTSGPAAGLVVFVAEDVQPAVTVGQHVTASTVIATMYNGPDGIETGWAQQSGLSAESELPEAGAIAGFGPFPTRVGVNFDELLHSLGVPAAPNLGQFPYGLLPARYPVSWG